MRLVFDIESDGLLDTISKIHCISIIDIDGGKLPGLFYEHNIEEGIQCLKDADLLIGHNIIGFDIPAIEKVYKVKLTNPVYDTLTASQLMFPMIERISRDVPVGKKNSHGLYAWGHRLHSHKGDFKGPWDVYTEEMGEYCKQDTALTAKLFEYLKSKGWPQKSVDLEMRLANILQEVQHNGILFDLNKAEDLYSYLITKRFELKNTAVSLFPAWYKNKGEFTYKKTGATVCKIELTEFNPGSRAHIIDRLKNKYNWVPVKFTEKDNVILDDSILAALPYPESKCLTELMLVQKRIAQLAEGKSAWLKLVDDSHRIHGRINQNGTRTGRATHTSPNLSQVPATRSEYGKECRELFIAPRGKVFVGTDLEGLELRCFAGYLKPMDKGSCIHTILTATKNVNDLYTLAGNACSLPRDIGKTLVLAMIYGAGNAKLGFTIAPDVSNEDMLKKIGKEARENIQDSIEGFTDLTEFVAEKFRERGRKVLRKITTDTGRREEYEYVDGWLTGLDGRKIYPKYEYSSLNTLLQSAGALISKQWIIETVDSLKAKGYTHGIDYCIVIWSHDELIIECDINKAEQVKESCLESTYKAGKFFNFPCPISGESKIGQNWYEVH